MRILDKHIVDTDRESLLYMGYRVIQKAYGVSKSKAKYIAKLYDKLYGIGLEECLVSSGVLVNREDMEKQLKDLETYRNNVLLTIERLLGKTFITSEEYTDMYIAELEKDIGKCYRFDKFMEWLKSEKEYGIVSAMCESDEYGALRYYWENEKINIDIVREKYNGEA